MKANEDVAAASGLTRRSFLKGTLGTFAGLGLGALVARCSGGGGGDPPDGSFPVLVFTDVHFYPFYDESLFSALNNSDFSQWASIFQSSSVTTPSAWGTDTNYPLLELMLAGVRQNLGASPLVIFTGDILGHDIPETFYRLTGSIDEAAMHAFTDKVVQFFMRQARSSLGSVPVLFAMGNLDSYTGLGPESSFLSSTAGLYYSQFLNSIVDQQTFLDTFTTGGYYAAMPAGMNLMVIGLNTFECSFTSTADAVNAQFAWLDATLASARAMGKKVWLLMHAPIGGDLSPTAQSVDANGRLTTASMMWNATYQTSFLQILAKYPGLITFALGAHTHMDEYRIMSSGNVLEITPGISPYFGNNPGFKVFTFSRDTLKAIDYTCLKCDLSVASPQFANSYTFSTAYRMQALLTDSLTELYPLLVSNSAQQTLYRGNYFAGHTYVTPVGNELATISNTTWPVYWAGIGNMDAQSLINAVNSY